MERKINHIIAPSRFSVYDDRIIFHVSVGEAYCLPYNTVCCVLFEGYDPKTRTTATIRPEAVAHDADGYLILYQADGTRWELHMFRCPTGAAGELYEMLYRHVAQKWFEFENEAVYRQSRVWGT